MGDCKMKKWFVLLAALTLTLGVGCSKGCSSEKSDTTAAQPETSATSGESAPAAAQPAAATGSTAGASKLTVTDAHVGDGAEAKAGQTVEVHYTGWLYDAGQPENKGQKFDSSVDRGETFKFQLGAGRVIRGWDEGVQGMKVKGKRTLVIPPDMGYGAQGAGGVIPPNATLIFDVELINVAN